MQRPPEQDPLARIRGAIEETRELVDTCRPRFPGDDARPTNWRLVGLALAAFAVTLVIVTQWLVR